MIDPSGTGLLSLQLGWSDIGRSITLTRLVGTPDDYEYIVQALVPAIILELNDRMGFDSRYDHPDNGTWT